MVGFSIGSIAQTISLDVSKTHLQTGFLGSAEVNPMSGTAPFTYSWNHGPTSNTVGGLTDGIYYLSVTDQLGNQGNAEVEIGHLILWDLAYSENITALTNSTISHDPDSTWGHISSKNTLSVANDGSVVFSMDNISGIAGATYNEYMLSLVPDTELSNHDYVWFGVGIQDNTAQIIQENNVVGSFQVSTGDEIRVRKKGDVFSIEKDNVPFYSKTMDTRRIVEFCGRMNFTLQTVNLPSLYVTFPFVPEPIKVYKKYAELSKTPTSGVFKTDDEALNFKFQNQYAVVGNDALKFKIFDDTRTVVADHNSIYIPKSYGTNWVQIPLNTAGLIDQKVYMMELIENKGEKYYLRFKFIDE